MLQSLEQVRPLSVPTSSTSSPGPSLLRYMAINRLDGSSGPYVLVLTLITGKHNSAGVHNADS